MGTTYTARGEITISPALTYAEIKKINEAVMGLLRKVDAGRATAPTVFDRFMPIKIETESSVEDTEQGIMTVIKGVALVPSGSGDDVSLSYDPADVIVAIRKAAPGHEWTGAITAVHEERHKAYRYSWTKGDRGAVVTTEEGTVVVRWPGNNRPDQDITDLL